MEFCKLPIVNQPDKFSLVDSDVYEWAKTIRWQMDRYGYVHSTFASPSTKNGYTKKFLHRLIMRAPVGLEVDHIHHCRHDNRRENLRVVTRLENLANRRNIGKIKMVRGLQPRSGVRKKSFYAYFCAFGTRFYVGSFETLELANLAREKAILTCKALIIKEMGNGSH